MENASIILTALYILTSIYFMINPPKGDLYISWGFKISILCISVTTLYFGIVHFYLEWYLFNVISISFSSLSSIYFMVMYNRILKNK